MPGTILFILKTTLFVAIITSHSLSTDKKPWPSCVEFDEQGIAYVCVIFYNTTFSDNQVSGCLKLSVLVEAEVIIPLKCFTVSTPKAFAVRGQNLEDMTQK